MAGPRTGNAPTIARGGGIPVADDSLIKAMILSRPLTSLGVYASGLHLRRRSGIDTVNGGIPSVTSTT
jgi:hypothetical protein